jgi:hypothetical protein
MLLASLAAQASSPAQAAAAGAPSNKATTDSLVFLKDGKVWVSGSDGSGARPFTSNAYGWSSPSMDDQGNVVVVGGLARINADGTDSDGSSEIYRFAPNGNQVGSAIPTWGSYSSPACPTYGPNSARVSPDGSKVAYGIWDCGSYDYTALWTPITSTGLSFPNQTLGQENFYRPQWVDSSQFVVSHAGQTVASTQSEWYVHPTSSGDLVGSGWRDDRVTGTGWYSVISRSGTTTAVITDDAADYLDGHPRNVQLLLWSAPSLAQATTSGWNLDCTVNLPAATISDPYHLSPSISPDGTRLYWGDDAGVEMAQIADRSNGCANVHPTLVVPGGSQPFVSAGALQAPDPTPTQPGPNPPPPPNTVYPPHAAFKVVTHHPRARHAVKFDASASAEQNGKIVGYVWKFGDDKKAKGRIVKHKYAAPGRYKVRLVVVDQRGVRARTFLKVKVRHAR